MEHISKALQEVQKQVPQQRTSSAPMRRPHAGLLPEILQIIARLELDKQIKLSDDQRSALAERLYDLNESKEHTQCRANHVLLTETYGTLAYQYWVSEQIRFPKGIVKTKEILIWCEDCKSNVPANHLHEVKE